MSAQHSTTTEEEASSSPPPTHRVVSILEERSRDGSLAALAGGVALASALTAMRTHKVRATALALAGVGLVGLGVRQQHAGDGVETGADARRDESGEKRVSDEAHAHAEQELGAQRNADESASVFQPETAPNPRGMSDGADVQADDGGEIDFVEGDDSGTHRETHLEDEDAHDPRLHPDSDDEPTEIDLSEAAMADEASEATGPHPEQAYPTHEGTDPEPTSAVAPERAGDGTVAPADSDGEERRTDEESREGDATGAESADDETDAESADDERS